MKNEDLCFQSLLTIRTDADKGDGGIAEFGEAGEVSLGVWRELIVAGAVGGVLLPAGERFVNRFRAIPERAVGWWEIVAMAVDVIGDADFQMLVFVESIDIGDGEASDAVDHASEAKQDGIEPAAAAWATGGSAELAAEIVEVFGKTFVNCWERA